MLQLAAWLRQWAADKVGSDARFAATTFIVSDAFEPGEGEHKVRWLVVALCGGTAVAPNNT
jgi:5'-3' exonuclease